MLFVDTCAISVLDIDGDMRKIQIQMLFTVWMCTKRHGGKPVMMIQPVLCTKEQSPCFPRYSAPTGMKASKLMTVVSVYTSLWRSSSASHAMCSLLGNGRFHTAEENQKLLDFTRLNDTRQAGGKILCEHCGTLVTEDSKKNHYLKPKTKRVLCAMLLVYFKGMVKIEISNCRECMRPELRYRKVAKLAVKLYARTTEQSRNTESSVLTVSQHGSMP